MKFGSADAISSDALEPDALKSNALQTVPPVPQLAIVESEIAPVLAAPLAAKISKDDLRRSLKASTLDGVFAAIFSNVTGGALLCNFLMELGASPAEIGVLASIPMLANLLQPIGAYLSERTTSLHFYCLWVYGISRSLWLLLAAFALAFGVIPHFDRDWLVLATIGIGLLSYGLGALGSAPWLSWMAVLVPRRLRGRYFGIRNSAANLTNLISIPLLGLMVSRWGGGSVQGFGVVLLLGTVSGLVSLAFQNFITDVNPQQTIAAAAQPASAPLVSTQPAVDASSENPLDAEPDRAASQPVSQHPLQWNANLLLFLLYFSLWMFAVSLSAPFFNLYMLDRLKLDISQVTLYNSLMAGANLLMLVLWGKLADRIGNRSILMAVGVLVALIPGLWLFTSTDTLSVWLWLPLLHLLMGGTQAAIDLCSNNLQLGVAPLHKQSAYFGIVAAFAGVSGALGTTAGGSLAQFGNYTGLLGLFTISVVLRLGALLPLVLVQEKR